MVRRRKEAAGVQKNPALKNPAWLITFSDLMTLILTFFVLLFSMAVIDERIKRVVLGSVSRTFSSGKDIFNPLGREQTTPSRVEPGPMEGAAKDLSAVRDMIFDDVDKDLTFQENKYVQILSINDEVLFVPGQTELSPRGASLLDRLVPYLRTIRFPLLVAGHTSARRDEVYGSEEYLVSFDQGDMDSTWFLSYRRALAVYLHMLDRGIAPDQLTLEAFGQFHPRYTNNTPEGRKKNRRVDIVLDKRNTEWISKVEGLREKQAVPDAVDYKGFSFDLGLPGGDAAGQRGRRPTGWGNN